MGSKFERMQAELRTAAERAKQLELELDAARTARAELVASQVASEREAQRLRTELQATELRTELQAAELRTELQAAEAEARLGAVRPLPAGIGESSTLTAVVDQALRSLPPSPTKIEKGTAGEMEGAQVLWRLESWLSSLDLGAIVARVFLPALRAQSADLRLEKQFAARLGAKADAAEVAAMLRETAVLEQISAAISRGAHALHADGERRKGSGLGQLGSSSRVQQAPPPPSLGKFVEEREAGPPGVGEVGRVERGEYSGRQVIVIKEDGTRCQCELIKEDGSKGALVWLEMDALKAVSPKLFTLTFGEPKDFVGGLVKLVGEPMGHRMLGMRQEHGAAADSHVEFEVGNYGTRTTTHLEWWFVVEPTAERVVYREDFV